MSNIIILIIAIYFALGFMFGAVLIGYNPIESKKPITPELQITVNDSTIDTVYIYRKP